MFLTECPILTPEIVWSGGAIHCKQTDPWTLRELLSTLERFKDETIADTKFYFFIDALNEFDGSHDDLADIPALLCDGHNIKICLSSREWPSSNTTLAWIGKRESTPGQKDPH